MAATVTSLPTRPDKLRRDQADQLLAAFHELEPELPLDLVRELFGAINRRTRSRSKWTFIMLSPEQNAAVVRYLRRHSTRPLVAMELWALCFEHLRNDTGEIMQTRDQLAEALGQPSAHLSEIMGELEKCGAIIRHREKVDGMRGPGMVRYFMNPRVATSLAGIERDRAQSKAPPIRTPAPVLTVTQGGKPSARLRGL